MTKIFKLWLVALLALGSSSIAGIANAGVECTGTAISCDNAQDGDNESGTDQSGSSASGDAVGGQVVGSVSSGDTSIDSTNRSEDVDISTGDTSAANISSNFTGQHEGSRIDVLTSDVDGDVIQNAQDGDNSSDVVQAAEASSGDGVGGTVIGVVTSAGGSADVVAANTSEDVDIDTGDGDAANTLASLVGQNHSFAIIDTSDVTLTAASNAQDGDNDLSSDQSASSGSGDGVGGQVIGIVSAGDTSVDSTNASEDVDISSGDTATENLAANFTGQNGEAETLAVRTDDVDANEASNAQDGDNSTDMVQAAEATSGDGVGGSVIGVVTAAGGSADVVTANTSQDIDVDTGDGTADNALQTIVGQDTANNVFVGDVFGAATNAQDGDNDLSSDQSASSGSGDGVGGLVVGIVSAGETSIDATNRSEDVDISTGDTTSDNEVASVTGQNDSGQTIIATDVTDAEGSNAQDGDNSTDIGQAAEATSGDGVGGSVIGVVTSAGGSADVVAANTSEDVGIDTGDGTATNGIAAFVGQASDGSMQVFADDVTAEVIDNAQNGDNDLNGDQSASGASGDGVGGQVLGIVSAGETSVDATNNSTDVDLETGDGDATNAFAAFVGQRDGFTNIVAADVEAGTATNVQDGDNSKELTQDAVASTGDAVGGQVAGVVTSAGGSADLVLANTSEDVDGESGDSSFHNSDDEFVGQSVGGLFIGIVLGD